jgi:dihydroorotase-like cyclic amidohydrolase
MNDLRIRGGIIQTPSGELRADIFIEGERVAALADPLDETPAQRELDATGRWILPGLVDLHTHTRVPGYEYKEDYRTASRAAARGGVTTFIDMPNVEPPTDNVERLLEKRKIAEQAGATGYKIFQVGGGYPHDPRLILSDPARLYDAFERVERTGLPCLVHPFSQSLREFLAEQKFAKGAARDIETFSSIYTRDVVWSSSVAVLLELQRATGVRLHLLHTHAATSLRLLRWAKATGAGVTVALDPKYFHLREEHRLQGGARGLPGGFIVENEERMAEIWQALDDGTIDIIDSDHAPHTLDDLKRAEADPFTGPWGSPTLEDYLSLLLTDVRAGRLRMTRLVSLLCETPARILGLYPEKGALLPGSSADLVIVDPDRPVRPSDEVLESKSAWTAYAGWDLIGAPVLTMLRGTVIAKEGKVTGEPGFGRYVAGRPQQWAEVRPGASQGLSLRPRDGS